MKQMLKLSTITNKIKLKNIHPGEVLREEFLIPLNISAYQLSKSIGVNESRISQIVNEKRSITCDTALRLSKFFGTTVNFWLNLQNAYDIEKLTSSDNNYDSIKPFEEK